MVKTSLLIVFIHGLFGWGANEQSANSWDGLRKGYWNGIPEFIGQLLKSQSDVQLNIIIPSLPPVDGIEVRGVVLQRRLNEALAACPEGTRAHLIAHSRGGIDARWVIAQPGMADKIASLTTIGTAHRGTMFMNLSYALLPLFRGGGKLLKLIEDLKRRLGMRSSEFYYHFLHGYEGSSEQMRQAFYPLTLKGAAEFNETHAERERLLRQRTHRPIAYFAYGGRVARVHMPFLRLSHLIIAWFGSSEERSSGNDGATSIWSAHYPWEKDQQTDGIDTYIRTVPFDHYEQVNWEAHCHRPNNALSPQLEELYRDIIQQILGA